MPNSENRNLRERLEHLVRARLPQKSRATLLANELDFRRDLGLDSMGLVELAFNVEREFAIDIIGRADALSEIYTVGDLLEFIEGCATRVDAGHPPPIGT